MGSTLVTSWSLLFVTAASSDKTLEILEELKYNKINMRVLNNKDKIVPFALNLGISEASGDYIVRVDSHALYPKNYLSSLYRYSIELRAENVGGVIQTKSQAENKKSLSIARVLFDKFGVGDSKFRVGTSEVCEVDTVPFGFFRRNCLIKLGSLM